MISVISLIPSVPLNNFRQGLAQNLQPVPYFVKKQFELFDAWLQHVGNMLHHATCIIVCVRVCHCIPTNSSRMTHTMYNYLHTQGRCT